MALDDWPVCIRHGRDLNLLFDQCSRLSDVLFRHLFFDLRLPDQFPFEDVVLSLLVIEAPRNGVRFIQWPSYRLVLFSDSDLRYAFLHGHVFTFELCLLSQHWIPWESSCKVLHHLWGPIWSSLLRSTLPSVRVSLLIQLLLFVYDVLIMAVLKPDLVLQLLIPLLFSFDEGLRPNILFSSEFGPWFQIIEMVDGSSGILLNSIRSGGVTDGVIRVSKLWSCLLEVRFFMSHGVIIKEKDATFNFNYYLVWMFTQIRI